ncbi:hypothetical protein LAZ67_23001706 [Cordylochernes scorpioides]|uniref:Transposase n=1 Tax=Cordylochernes scorpioides TaxID=51811 RepID=A0ABY6LQW1_9ARAC|nr:hypothetical protein LAZ67_23001706 [Cordylochernes scorpioides]
MPGHRKRRQFKQTDAFTRGMVIGLKRAGWSIRQIAADTHLGASTVHRLWRRWLEQGNVAIYRNVGATRVTSARVDRRILRQAVAAPQATCTAILQHVQDTLDHSISTRTIYRRLVANGLHSCRPLRRLPLTPPNRRQRLEWCRARSTWMTEWHRVVFSDESRFCLSSDSRRVRVWRRRGERSNPAAIVERPTVRQREIMVWGAIAYDSRSPLLRIQGTMTAQRYVDDVLRPVTLPYLQGVPNALYQQDNARPHTARIIQQALQDVQMLPWPPYPPDLSPIEHVWDIIGRRLHALPQPRSEDELWQMVEREWRAIPQDAIRTLIDSLPRRVAACIAVRDSEGYSFLKGCEDYLAIQKELPGIIRTTTDQLIQNDQMKITDSIHFAHYKFLSESFMTEEYLRLNISLPNKRLVAQHRVLWQFFREERKDFWKENGRNCLLCMDLMDDNLVHYFFQCPLLTEKRTEIFTSPTSGQFRYHRICQLLSSALNDELLIVRYFKFCTEAGRMRKNARQRILEDELSELKAALSSDRPLPVMEFMSPTCSMTASRPFSCLCLGHTQSLHFLLTSTQQPYCRIMSSQKRERESITIEKKKEICQLAKNNATMSKNEIGERFSLPRTTVRDIFTQAEKWKNGASISPAIIDEHLTNLNGMLANSGYDPANIYNAVETGLFFQLIPDRTLAHKDENCRGVKRMKQRIAVLLCCNSTGTDKRRLLIIGKSAKPRCFRNFSPHFYGTYTSNSKKWMTSSIFQEWLLQFNKQLVSEGRRILLLFLPPNMTASLQPMDSGIIKSFKAQYRKLQLQKIVVLADAHLPTESRMDYAVRYCEMAWHSVSPDSISNCWNHRDIRFTSTAAVEPLKYGNLLDRIRDISAITPENLRTEREFQLVDDSQEAEMKLTDDNLLVSTVTAKEELGEDDDATVTQRLPSLREARTAAETVLLFLEHSKRATSDDVNLSADLLRRVYAISEGEKTQVVITDFFKKM